MLTRKDKQKIIAKFRTHDNDTGSPQVQIAILTEEIKQLTEHLKNHKHDHSSRRGLLKKVGERRRLLKYLQKEDEKSFKDLTGRLKLKIAKRMQEEEDERIRIEEELNKKDEIKVEEEEAVEPAKEDEEE
ncbi:MAG: 30S ribosomal protein S15 [Patescibacteria group bacterium]